jgi:uncharacterized iron-regulated membrane protein
MKKEFFFQIHKWLGILSGVIVFIVCITGCIYTFYDELKLQFYPDRYLIETPKENGVPLPLSKLTKIAQAALPVNEKISRVDLYPASNRTWIFRAQKTDEAAFGYGSYQQYYQRVFLDPYTGEIQFVENTKYEFFQVVLQLHMNLLLGKKIGALLVNIATIVFLVLLVTGMVLWWPRNWKWKNIRRAIWLNTSVKWKRLVYDLHNVSGFYSLFFAIILSFTGLVFGLESVKKNYAAFFNQFSDAAIKKEKQTQSIPGIFADPLDNAFHYTLANNSQADMMSIRLRNSNQNQHDIQVRLKPNRTGSFRWYYFDGSGTQIKEIRSGSTLALGDRLVTLNFDLHTGSIGGIPTRILAFIVSLIGAALPVTGYIMWWNKRKKK